MTSLLVRGKVHTFDASRPVATNLLLRDGVVQEVGSDAEHADRIIELEPDEIVQPGGEMTTCIFSQHWPFIPQLTCRVPLRSQICWICLGLVQLEQTAGCVHGDMSRAFCKRSVTRRN